jgi:K+-transporting ATPase KdpF subunit
VSACSAAMLDLILGGAVSAGLLIYLVWALVRPEDF